MTISYKLRAALRDHAKALPKRRWRDASTAAEATSLGLIRPRVPAGHDLTERGVEAARAVAAASLSEMTFDRFSTYVTETLHSLHKMYSGDPSTAPLSKWIESLREDIEESVNAKMMDLQKRLDRTADE